MAMLKNFMVLLSRKIVPFQSSLPLKYTVMIQTTNMESRKFSTSVSNNSSSAVTLSHDVFQPDKASPSTVPVVILHGLLGSKKNWRGLGKAIAVKNKRTVYTLDARNHGDSPHSSEFDYPLMVEDVKQFMKSQSISEAVVIGHSMGGRTAMLLALTHAMLVNKLVVVDVSPSKMPKQSLVIPDYMRAMKEAITRLPASSLVQARNAVDEFLSKTVPEVSIRQFLLTNLVDQNNIISWKPNIDILLEKFNSNVMAFPRDTGHYAGDTLFVCGGDSPFVIPEDEPSIQAIFPKSAFVRIPKAGHWVHSEKPTEFLEAVNNFL